MVIEYHRPQTLEDALKLIGRSEPKTVPLGGGSSLNHPGQPPLAVVDLQALGFSTIQSRGNFLDLGATLTLQALLENAEAPEALKTAIRLETGNNLRQVATVAGTLVSAGGRSPFTTAMLALDATLIIQPGEETLGLGDLLPLRAELLRGRLITRISLPLNARLAFQSAARTPADQPLVCAAAAIWPSGRARLALGGFGPAPMMVFDGSEAAGAEEAARSAYSQAGDQWASAEYRSQVAGVLARRCLGLEVAA